MNTDITESSKHFRTLNSPEDGFNLGRHAASIGEPSEDLKAYFFDRAKTDTRAARELLADLTDEQRRKVFGVLAYGYCTHCGGKKPEGGNCQCWNEE